MKSKIPGVYSIKCILIGKQEQIFAFEHFRKIYFYELRFRKTLILRIKITYGDTQF